MRPQEDVIQPLTRGIGGNPPRQRSPNFLAPGIGFVEEGAGQQEVECGWVPNRCQTDTQGLGASAPW